MFTQKQVEILLQNKQVNRCTPKSISYSTNFKLQAIKRYYDDGYSPSMIFEEAGFDIDIIGKERSQSALKRWRKAYTKGGKKLLADTRGRSAKKKQQGFKNKDKQIEYLETKVQYLNAENDFLAKLRGLKRE
jgi:transposase-like protein